MNKYFIYCRKSSEAEDRQVLSIESQKTELLKVFAEKENLNIVEILEESYSAKAPGRSVFDSMIKRIEKGEANGIIAWHPDRLARNSVDGGKIIYLSDIGKIVDLKFSTYNFENTSQGKFMLTIIFGQSKYYVDSLSENVKRGNRTKLEKGLWPGQAPIGYLNEKVGKTIIKDPERFSLVKKMWDLMLTGSYSPAKIMEIANNEWGLRTVRKKRIGGKPLALSTVYRILTNPFYTGIMERNGETYKGKHESMISIEEFDRVQFLLGRKGKPAPKKHVFAFTGMIRCADCGCLVTAEEKINRYGYHYTYYHCTKKKREMNCRQSSIRLEELEKQILNYLTEIHVLDTYKDWAVKYLKEKQEKEKLLKPDISNSLQKALLQNHSYLENLNKMRYRELINDDEYMAQKNGLLKEAVSLKEKLGDRNPDNWLEPSQKCFIFANRAKNWFENGNLENKRLILETVGSNLFLKDKKLSIQAIKPFDIFENQDKFLSWHPIVEAIRTFFKNNTEYINIPIVKSDSPDEYRLMH
ncbi:MAG: recombinase family protein [Candidatus Schekmanbacteria bacterium]|nr:recombinase family protein [Candidatus Schekmanbacteria bacterium]